VFGYSFKLQNSHRCAEINILRYARPTLAKATWGNTGCSACIKKRACVTAIRLSGQDFLVMFLGGLASVDTSLLHRIHKGSSRLVGHWH